ncbi:guanine nucleotide-binding protein subunit beta-like protein 1 isoform X2 [Liolophura sinensis]
MLRGSDSPITALHFVQDESTNQQRVLASGNVNGHVQLWDLKTYRCVESLALEEGKSVLWIEKIPVSGDIITQSRAGKVCIWLRKDDSFIKSSCFPSGSMGFCSGCLLSTSSTSQLVAIPSSGDQSQVDIIDIQNNVPVMKLKPASASTKQGMCMAIKRVSHETDVSQMLVGYESGNVLLWDLRAQKTLDTFKAHEESLMCLDCCASKKLGISGSTDTVLSTWKISSDDKIQYNKAIEITNPGVSCVLVRNDAKLFATGGWDSRVRIFGVKKLNLLAVLTSHTDSVQCLTFSQNNMLACGSKDKRISLWDIYK